MTQATATEKALPTLSPEVLEMAETIKKAMSFDDKSGLATLEEGTYIKLLPAGISEEQVRLLQKHNGTVVAAGSLALAEVAIPVMKKHPAITEAKLNMPTVGKDDMDFLMKREIMVPGGKDDKGNPIQRPSFGSVTVKSTQRCTADIGEFGKVKQVVRSMAMDAFGS